jgi:uncharacterized membrane protein YgdD (TMEM256/DUF423 family)
MNKTILTIAFLMGFTAVALGAFGAHALSEVLESKALESFKTAVYYQMTHSIVLVIIGSVNRFKLVEQKRLFYLFLGGIVLFSGSIYAYYLVPLLGIELSFLVYLTPIGGLLFLTGWLLAAFYSFRRT